MPRPQRDLDPNGGPLVDFARELRTLREQAGSPKFAAMERRTGRSKSTLAEAAGGQHLPRWDTVADFVRACGADPTPWRTRWQRLREELGAPPSSLSPLAGQPDDPFPPTPDSVDQPASLPTEEAPSRPETIPKGGRGLDGNPGRRALRRPLIYGTVGAFVIVVLVVASLAAYESSTPDSAVVAAPRPSATIITPDATRVQKTFQLAGAYRDLPPGLSIWVATFDPAKKLFFPQDKPCVTLPDDTFNCGQYYVGEQDKPDGSTYRLDVIAADASASNSFLQYQIDKGGPTGPDPGLQSLPIGATPIYSRSVIRIP